MRKIVILGVIICVLALNLVCVVGTETSHARSMLLIDANNKYCPVTGDVITRKKYNTGYSGKKYWFSSYDAVRKFKESPGSYARNLKADSSSTKSTQSNSTTKRKRFWRY